MAGKNTAVFAIFDSRAGVEKAVSDLRNHGFRAADISALLPQNTGNKDLALEKETKAPEGLATGATGGAILGGTLGWLVGIGSLAIPGAGPFLAAGPIMAALSGAALGGAVGGVGGALVGMGIPEYEAKRYEGMVKDGGILVSVHCDNSDWVKRAKDTFQEAGGRDIASHGESHDIVEGTGSDRPYDKDERVSSGF